MSDSVQPHRQQPTRLLCPWDSPGENTGAGCHFLLQCTKVKSESEVAQSCPTLCDPVDCSLPGSSVHGIFQARVLEWAAIAFSGNCPRHGQWETFWHASYHCFDYFIPFLTSHGISGASCTYPAFHHVFSFLLPLSMLEVFLSFMKLLSWLENNWLGGFPGGSEVKASASTARDLGSIPESGRSPGEGNGNPLQYSCLENPMDREAW